MSEKHVLAATFEWFLVNKQMREWIEYTGKDIQKIKAITSNIMSVFNRDSTNYASILL